MKKYTGQDALDSQALKRIFSQNLNRLLGDTPQIDVANAIGIIPATFSSWCVGKNMPRMDKVELLANYFGVNKSDLIEESQKPSLKDETGLSEDETNMLNSFRALTLEQQENALLLLDALSKKKQK